MIRVNDAPLWREQYDTMLHSDKEHGFEKHICPNCNKPRWFDNQVKDVKNGEYLVCTYCITGHYKKDLGD